MVQLVITLMATAGIPDAALSVARDCLQEAGARITAEQPFDAPFAIDWLVDSPDSASALRQRLEQALPAIDLAVQPADVPRRRKLLLADMDSTMIQQECIDELADFAGLKAEIAAITEQAMLGELDFPSALRARVAALQGLPADAITRCLEERIHLTPGARALIATMNAHGARTVLVSGGFTAFTGHIAAELGFHRHVANRLGITGGKLDGTVGEPIIDSATKLVTLREETSALGLSVAETLAIGDGANDIPMIRAAGLGIAFHGKPKTVQAADMAVRHGDLRMVLWAQGLPRREWVGDTAD